MVVALRVARSVTSASPIPNALVKGPGGRQLRRRPAGTQLPMPVLVKRCLTHCGHECMQTIMHSHPPCFMRSARFRDTRAEPGIVAPAAAAADVALHPPRLDGDRPCLRDIAQIAWLLVAPLQLHSRQAAHKLIGSSLSHPSSQPASALGSKHIAHPRRSAARCRRARSPAAAPLRPAAPIGQPRQRGGLQQRLSGPSCGGDVPAGS